ncbi:acyl-CoA synthetase (AMP-forming)/AMP-acid ligase II/AcrR family transcriptional regulator [Pseudacidovorax sp. 1753]|uniref:AMP-binding protein n=1 Tax=Pseudacidovorax sp. 1753 TaxID=3156419 RepID=UPI003390C750
MPTESLVSPWPGASERQQRHGAKRDAVLQAAAALFTSRGVQGTSIDDIARRLGVTKPTVYHYVQAKEQILFECMQRGLAALRDAVPAPLGAVPPTQARSHLREALQAYAAAVTSPFGLCVVRLGEELLAAPRREELAALRAEIDARFHALIDPGMQAGWIVRSDAAMAVYTVVGALGGIGRWYRPDEHADQSLQDAVRHGIEMLMRGVLAEPAPAPAPQAAPSNLPWGAPMPEIRREVHFDGRMVRCFVQRPGSIAQMLVDAVAGDAEADALVCGALRLSWRELQHAVARCAGGLAARGVTAGERVALYLGNGPEFVIATLACAWLGAVAMPISMRARTAELAYNLADAEAAVLICAEELQALVPDAQSLPALRLRVATGQVAPGFEAFDALMQSAPRLQPQPVQEEDLAVLLYTSGTTGRPKGAMISHFNVAHSVQHFAHAMQLGPRDRSLVAVPLSHVTGLVAQLYTLVHCRGCMVLMPQFKAADCVRLIEQERITHSIMVPAMYNLCLLLPEMAEHDLGSWRIGAYGGASMPTATIEALAERLPGLTLMNAYGATETCSPATIMPAGMTATHRDSVGLPVACGDICVVDEAGNELPRGEAGEIWIAGPMVVRGYWRNEAATASEFRGGFWRSGDIGSMDADGFLRILDRKKDVINRGGYKIFCAQVENVLAEHPRVVEAALVGVPCAVLGERVHAFACVDRMDEDLQAALAAFCAERLSDYAVPETWTLGTEPLPRNLNGKILKRELRQTLRAALG